MRVASTLLTNQVLLLARIDQDDVGIALEAGT